MKKLALELDQLTVESFATSAADRPAGTVRGNGDSEMYSECATCGYTCGDSCACPTMLGDTCGITCFGTCDDLTCYYETCLCGL